LTVDSSGYIYAGTYGTGLYRSVQPLTSITEREHLLPFSYYVYNYPNPFNPTTNIEFSIAHSTFVRLDIFDLLGRLISTLVSERMQPGIYTRRWDGSRVTSGVYLCRIQTEDFRSTKKIVLIK